MPRPLRQTKKPRRVAKISDPAVIVDFIFDRGLFFIAIKNIGDKSAFKISVQFDKKILGVEGTKEISALPLFQNIEFLPPHKEIVTFLDTSASYFGRKEPTKISTRVSYYDIKRTKHAITLKHDLGIYAEIGYVQHLADQGEVW